MTRAAKTFTLLGLLAFVLVVLVPFWWIASMSFKTYEQIQFATSIYVPKPFTWENYTGLWSETRFPLWLRNSLVTAVVVTLITTVIATPQRLRGGPPALPRPRRGGQPDPDPLPGPARAPLHPAL